MGETGSGKDTVANLLPYPKIVSYKTGPMRPSDVQGVTHHFISDEKMDELVASGKMLAYTKTGEVRYCATVDQLVEDTYVYIINPDGVRWMKRNYKGDDVDILVFGLYNDLATRIGRCESRGDDPNVVCDRIIHEQLDFFQFRMNGEFDYIINNRDSRLTALTVEHLIDTNLELLRTLSTKCNE